MDVVALAQHGIPYAVATLGTATSQEQINQLFRIVPEIIFCFDGDQAGRKAGWRALENSLPVLRDGVQARFLFLPDGEDPDSLVRKEGQQTFEQRLQSATPLSDFLLNHLAEQVDLSSMDGRARLSELAKPLIAKLADGVFRDLLVNKLAETIGLSSATIAQRLPETSPDRKQRPTIQASRPQGKYKITNNPTRLAIAILLHYPEVANSVILPDALLRSNLPGLDLLYKLHGSILQSATTSSSVLLERWRDMPEEKHLIKLMQWDIPGTETNPQRIQLFEDALANLQLQHIEQRLETLLAKSDQHTLSDEEKIELGDLYRTRIE
jgi:DNA primase